VVSHHDLMIVGVGALGLLATSVAQLHAHETLDSRNPLSEIGATSRGCGSTGVSALVVVVMDEVTLLVESTDIRVGCLDRNQSFSGKPEQPWGYHQL